MNTYYHNPKCSKSRAGLKLLNEFHLTFTVKEYLKETLTQEELKDILKKLKLDPLKIIRQKENLFKELNLSDKNLSNEEWINIIVKNPILLERPIYLTKTDAAIGRPTDNFLRFKNSN